MFCDRRVGIAKGPSTINSALILSSASTLNRMFKYKVPTATMQVN